MVSSFVGVDIKQELDRGLLEMKSPKNWETAFEKSPKNWETAFEKSSSHFPSGIKERQNPLSFYDENIILEETVSDKEYDEAKDLPYREICGVLLDVSSWKCGMPFQSVENTGANGEGVNLGFS